MLNLDNIFIREDEFTNERIEKYSDIDEIYTRNRYPFLIDNGDSYSLNVDAYRRFILHLCAESDLTTKEREYCYYYFSDFYNFDSWQDEDINLKIFLSNCLDNEYQDIPKLF